MSPLSASQPARSTQLATAATQLEQEKRVADICGAPFMEQALYVDNDRLGRASGAGLGCQPFPAARPICSTSLSMVAPYVTRWFPTPCDRPIRMFSIMGDTRPMYCFWKLRRQMWTSMCTPPSMKCAFVRVARFTVLFRLLSRRHWLRIVPRTICSPMIPLFQVIRASRSLLSRINRLLSGSLPCSFPIIARPAMALRPRWPPTRAFTPPIRPASRKRS